MNRTLKFRLAGRNLTVDRDQIDEAVKHVLPGPIDKYFVRVNGKAYPPKQLIAAALQIPPADFITTDATRILRNLGYKIERQGVETVVKTLSEQLFEEYLRGQGLPDFSFEPKFTATVKRPDYALLVGGEELLFEVKEFRATAEDLRPGFMQIDPYGPIREKINAAREKFRQLREYPCCLVLHSGDKPVDLGWRMIYGAMLGNIAFRMPFHPQRGLISEAAEVGPFGGGGKMLRYRPNNRLVEPQNQTISAIVVLERLPVGKWRFRVEVEREEGSLGRRLSWEEFHATVQQAQGTERDFFLTQLRVVVCENPYALKRLRRDVFLGPYDECYGPDETGREIVRISAGDQLQRLEELAETQGSPTRRITRTSERKREKELK